MKGNINHRTKIEWSHEHGENVQTRSTQKWTQNLFAVRQQR